MVELAILIGIYSLLVFANGIIGKISNIVYLNHFFVFSFIFLLIYKKTWKNVTSFFKDIKGDKTSLFLLIILFAGALINLIGVLGPELGFDALWYHLTIPKIYLNFNKIFYIPGSLFYYSAMPKLTEMLYIAALQIDSYGILAKGVHYTFGILCCFSLYGLSRKYLNIKNSLLTVIIFYISLVVGWLSITTYVDLARTFFEILALKLFLEWSEGYKDNIVKNIKLFESAIMVGLAISTKLIALASLPVFLILIFLRSKKFLLTFCFSLITLLIVSPWLLFSYIHTGNPIYPIFSGILDQTHGFVVPNILGIFTNFWKLFYNPQDLISPIFLIFVPIVVLRVFKNGRNRLIELGLYVFLSMIFWSITPKTGGSRFFLPYLPALSLLLVFFVSLKEDIYKKVLLPIVIFVSVINIGYRFAANFKFIPVVLGKQSKEEFLVKNLNFNFGDFYDIKSEIGNIVGREDLVLIYGSHNLFYVNFPYFHSTFMPKSTQVSYILTQDYDITKEYGNLKLVYQNKETKVNLYLYGKQNN